MTRLPPMTPTSDSRWLRRGVLAAVAAALAVTLAGSVPPAQADDPDNCLLCHQYRGLGRYDPVADAVHLYFVSPDYERRHLGAHARIACTDCHNPAEVSVIPHEPTSPVNCTQMCHLRDPAGLERRFSHASVEDALNRSIHNFETFAELEFEHGPLLNEGQSYCLYCHDEPLFRDPEEIITTLDLSGPHAFDRCDGCHTEYMPVDARYYVRHITARLRTARPPLELVQTCSVCHSDKRIREQYDLQDASVRYTSTYHGKAALLGSDDTADCINCHIWPGEDSHLIRSQADPASITHPTNKADSCRTPNCHPGADKQFGQASVHLDLPSLGSWEIALAVFFFVFTLLTFGPSLVITVLELFQVVVGRHVPEEAPMKRLTMRVLSTKEGRRKLRRFSRTQRIEHWLLALVFGTLVLTGFPMKFASHEWARYVIEGLGGLHVARVLHHWAGVVLFAGFILHLLLAVGRTVRGGLARQPDGSRYGVIRALTEMPMVVTIRDLRKSAELMAYLLFLKRKPPTWGRFTIDQKFEYVGVFWGTMLLGVTGFMLWDAAFFSHYISGRAFNLALIAHTYEAFLAVIHVGILHICHVVFAPDVFPFSPATLTGTTPVTRLAEVHGEQVIDAARELGIEIPPEVQHG